MIAHIVTFVWREGAEPDVAQIASRLMAMAAGLPELRFYRAGPNLRLRPGADFAVIAVVADAEGLDAYLDSPVHVEIVAQNITPHLGTRQAVQLDLAGPELPAEWV